MIRTILSIISYRNLVNIFIFSIPLSGALQFQAREITKFGAHSLRKNQLRLLVKVTINI